MQSTSDHLQLCVSPSHLISSPQFHQPQPSHHVPLSNLTSSPRLPSSINSIPISNKPSSSSTKSIIIPPVNTAMQISNFFKSRRSVSSNKSNHQPRSPINLLSKLKLRVSNLSPDELKPKTWDDYQLAYSKGELDIEHPPLPPLSVQLDPKSNFRTRFFPAPLPQSEPSRQAVLNRLGYYDPGVTTPLQSPPYQQHHPFRNSNLNSPSSTIDSPTFPDSPTLQLPPSPLSSASSSASFPHTTSHGFSSRKPPSLSSPTPNSFFDSEDGSRRSHSTTLEDHPAFHEVVNRCQAHFSVAGSMVTVLDDDRNIFLAETGTGGMKSASRDFSYCAHTILNGNRVFAVLDTLADWRFANSPTETHRGTRFYAGAPIFAPHLPGLLESPPEEPVCIGTLCIIDSRPRKSFSEGERQILLNLASECRELISGWFLEKVARKLGRLDHISLSDWTPLPTSPKPIRFIDSPLSSPGLVATSPHPSPSLNPPKRRSFPRRRFISSPRISAPILSPTTLDKDIPINPLQSIPAERIAKFDLATKLLAETLELTLVYLVAVLPPSHDSSGPVKTGEIMIISSHDLPTPAPVLEYDLHLTSIRKGNDGLIFQKPPIPLPRRAQSRPSSAKEREQVAEWEDFAFDRNFDAQLRASRKRQCAAASDPNQSGILLSVGPEREMGGRPSLEVGIKGGGGGFVLAGYSHDPKRVLGIDDLAYFKHFARQLAKDVEQLF